jgi:hypothetical protein
MHLIYVDESGNTGKNLTDAQQPIFVLTALVVPEDKWVPIEQDLFAALNAHFPARPPEFEVHAAELRNGDRFFRGLPVATRIAFRDEWLKVAQKHNLRLITRAIVKKRYERWIKNEFPVGVSIDPHVVAFPLVAQIVNDYLKNLPGSPRGIFISDEQTTIVGDVEKTIRLLRGIASPLKLSQIIEKGFFIDSRKSLHLQLCDMCAFSARKKEEIKAGLPAKPVDASGIKLIEPLIHRGPDALQDVLQWIVAETQSPQKKERPGA